MLPNRRKQRTFLPYGHTTGLFENRNQISAGVPPFPLCFEQQICVPQVSSAFSRTDGRSIFEDNIIWVRAYPVCRYSICGAISSHSHFIQSPLKFLSCPIKPSAAPSILSFSTELIFFNTYRLTSSLSLLIGLPMPTPILTKLSLPTCCKILLSPLCPLALKPAASLILIAPSGFSSSSCTITNLPSYPGGSWRLNARQAVATGFPLSFM